MTCGIYQIYNLVNNKLYIGSSKNIDKRRKLHIYQLNNNQHINICLQRSWNKHGENAFEFRILEECILEKLIEREQYWLDKYKSYDKNIGYNIRTVAQSNWGIKWSEEYKRDMSFRLKGKFFSKEHLEKIKLGIINSPKQFPNKRNLKKWPHSGGKRCSCDECKIKLNIIRQVRAKLLYNKKRGITIIHEMINP